MRLRQGARYEFAQLYAVALRAKIPKIRDFYGVMPDLACGMF